MLFRKLFLKYIKQYLVIFLCLVTCSAVIAFVSYRSLSKYCVEVNTLQLQENIASINNNISKMTMLAQVVNQSESFTVLIRQKDTSSDPHVVSLQKANATLKHLGAVYSFSPYYFTLFSRNNIFVSTSQCSSDFSTYYERFMNITDNGVSLSAAQVREQFFSLADINPVFWQVDSFSANLSGKEVCYRNALLCIIGGNSEGFTPPNVMIFVLDQQSIITQILPQELQEKGYLKITNRATGEEILTYGTVIEGNQMFPSTIAGRLDVSIGFPRAVIFNQTMPILITLLVLIIASLCFALYMTLRLSNRDLLRLKQLVSAFPTTGQLSVLGKEDEYTCLSRVMKKVTSDLEEYHGQLEIYTVQNQAIRMENLITNGINTQEDKLYFHEHFPGDVSSFCIVLMRIHTEDISIHNMAVLLIKEYLKETYANTFLTVPLNKYDEIFLFSINEVENHQRLKTLFANIISTLALDMHITFNVAMSAIGSDLTDIHSHYNQARQVMLVFGQEEETFVEEYSISPLAANENTLSLEFLMHLFNLLLSASHAEIQKQFSQLMVNYERIPLYYEAQKQQIFFSIRHVICNAVLQSALSNTDQIELPNYHNAPFDALIRCLQESCLKFCDCIEASKRSHNLELKERILSFIHAHYTDPELTPAVVCKNVGIADKYLFSFIKEQTGETFASYLEKLRIEKAKELLVQTNYSNEQIASLTGFTTTTTFYRAFQRRNMVSPGVYRNSRR